MLRDVRWETSDVRPLSDIPIPLRDTGCPYTTDNKEIIDTAPATGPISPIPILATQYYFLSFAISLWILDIIVYLRNLAEISSVKGDKGRIGKREYVITKETIEKVLDAARIEEVVGDFVDLKKRGTSLIGNCPFHNEKTPSFHVSVAKGIYKCFGCGAGGDSLKFVMELEKYSYPEAIRYLADKYSIPIEEVQRSPAQLAAQ